MTELACDPAAVKAWLALVHGQAPGLTHICSTGDWTGKAFAEATAATGYVTYLAGEGREGIYARVTTLKAALAPGRRGGAADTMALPALWADIDIAGAGHAEANLPPNEDAARTIIATSGLPTPTLWIHSGGGLYPIWLLDNPYVLGDDPTDQGMVKHLCAQWQKIITAAADRLGWHYGSGVGDLSRVLRIPGTVNRKAGLQRACRIIEHAGPRHQLVALRAALAHASAVLIPAAIPPASLSGHAVGLATPASSRERTDADPGVDFNTRASWAEILTPHGWRWHNNVDGTDQWTRPGKDTGVSATTNALGTDRLHVFSTSAAPLQADESYHKFAAFTILNHRGDFAAAARELLARGYGTPIDHTGEQWAMMADILGPEHRDVQAALIVDILGPGVMPTPVPKGGERKAGRAAGPPSRFFTESGSVLVAALTDEVLAQGPLAVGADDILWAHQHGVWSPARHVVRDRLAAILGDRYRRTHVGSVEDVVRSSSPFISCDPIPDVINFRNGLLDWRTAALSEHSPGVLSTVQLTVAWDPQATCPRFESFLAQVVPADMVEVVWELVGYLMMSGNPLHKAVMLMGTGRNGKGTLLRAIVALLGARNVTAASLQDLVATRFTTASLFGKLANIAGDIDATYLESTAIFKAITGQDQISAEHKGRDRFDFTPWAVPVFSANEIPPSADTSTGYLSRWLPIPFPNSFIGREDRTLDAQLSTELAGIAAKAVPALRRLMVRGEFERPASALAALEEFARRVDQVRSWLGDCCEPIPPLPHDPASHPFIKRTTVYEAYRRWCARDGHRALQASRFYDRLEGAGATPVKVRGERGYRGVVISDGAEPGNRGVQGKWWLTDGDDPRHADDQGGSKRADGGAGGGHVGGTRSTGVELGKLEEGAGGAAPDSSMCNEGTGLRVYASPAHDALGVSQDLPPLPPPAPLINSCRICGEPLDAVLAPKWHDERIHPRCQE